jgi:hypothetical protein
LSFVQGLTCKWISAQESSVMLGYKRLSKTTLDLGLVRYKLGWIGQDKFSLKNKKSASAQWIVIMVHLNTKKYSKRNQSVSLCNDSVIVTTICETYNDFVIVTTIHETYNDSINRYNVSVQLIQRLFLLNHYNDS